MSDPAMKQPASQQKKPREKAATPRQILQSLFTARKGALVLMLALFMVGGILGYQGIRVPPEEVLVEQIKKVDGQLRDAEWEEVALRLKLAKALPPSVAPGTAPAGASHDYPVREVEEAKAKLLWIVADLKALHAEKEKLTSQLNWGLRYRDWGKLLLCGLPFFLTVCLIFIAWGHGDRLQYTLALRSVPAGADKSTKTHENLASAFENELLKEWSVANDRAYRARREILLYGILLGTAVSGILLYCASVIVHANINALAETGHQPKIVIQAVAAATALVVAFVVAIANIIVRASRQDTNAYIFGTACRSCFLATITALLVTAGLIQSGTIESPLDAMILGTIIGITGDHLVAAIFEGVAMVFGASSGNDDNIEELIEIEGLNETERLRLKEQGVTSLQSLATSSPAYLFFSTRYNLDRICDWQDQSLLMLLLGPARAKLWREQYLVREATDALDFVKQFLSETSGQAKSGRKIPFEQLGFASEMEALEAFKKLRNEPFIARVALWKECTPYLETDHKEPGKEPSAQSPTQTLPDVHPTVPSHTPASSHPPAQPPPQVQLNQPSA